MRARRMTRLFAALMALLLVGCAKLPPEALLSNAADEAQAGTPVGTNQVGEACEYRGDVVRDFEVGASRSFGLWCGTWQQPSGHVFEARRSAANDAELASIAMSSGWRAYLNQRLLCAAPAATSILDGVKAELMNCTMRNGGWPHIALATRVDGKTFLVDGVPSALPALESTVAHLSGRSTTRASGGQSSAARLLAQRYAAQPFGSGDLDRYYGLKRLGDEKNAIDDFAGAEDAYRDALAVQQKILGLNNPGLATTLMHLAVQVSNQQRFTEADALLARAEALAAHSPDPLIMARLHYYVALDAANQRDRAKATAFAAKAAQEYAAAVPADLLERARRGQVKGAEAEATGDSVLQQLFFDPITESAIRDLASVWRFQATLAYDAKAFEDSRKIAAQAQALLELSHLNPPGTLPRVIRIAALSDARVGDFHGANRGLTESANLFDQLTPNEKPFAITLLLAGREARDNGDLDGALRNFRAGAKVLRDRHLGVNESLLAPYLETLLDESKRQPKEALALAAEMFEAAQLVQSGLTAQYIAKAATRLAAGDKRVSAALRKLQETEIALKALFRERDTQTQKPAAVQDAKELARIDAAIAETQAARDEAEAAAQAAAPAYGQLIQSEASAATTIALLQPGEGLLSILLQRSTSFGFLVTRDGVKAFRIALTAADAASAVEHLRESARADDKPDSLPPAFDVAAAHALYQKLFGPIEADVKDLNRLVVSSNGALLTLPFEMLVTAATPPVTNGDYRPVPFLLKRFAVSYVPAPQTFVLLRQIKAASAAPRPYIGFGDPRLPSRAQLAASFAPDRCKSDFEGLSRLGDLPGTREEVMKAGHLLGARPEDIILGAEFTKSALLHGHLDQYRVVHLATHAFLPTELRCKSEPTILMSPPAQAADAKDAFLDASEILDLDLDADLVVLSACNTAGPGGAAGESLSGLARAFFFAGSRGLLVTHWPVDDDSANFIITREIAAMRPGATQEDTAEALRQAKLARLMSAGASGGPPVLFSHPFAWAPFVLIGDGVRAPIKAAAKA
jgi:CHAT domain-containing protein